MAKKQKKKTAPEPLPKDFLDMIAPTAVKFNTDHYILGGTYHCTLAVRGYPTVTEELALLSRLGERSGVNLTVYARQVTAAEEQKIIQNASNRGRFERGSTSDMKQSVTAEANLQDVATLVTSMHRSREPLIHCAVYLDLAARDLESLRALRDEVTSELVRSKLAADRILLRQREGFLSANPAGRNAFGTQFERVLPASSVANLFPFNYSGKTDPEGFYIGKDKYGSNIIVDLDRRASDKTNASILILGNSGQGKSFLLKLLVCNLLESGKSVICLDPEQEMGELCANLGGCFVDLMTGQYRINPLEPKVWNVDGEDDPEAPSAFREGSRLSQHISFLKDPILSDLYKVMEDAYQNYASEENPLYPKDLLQEVLLGLHSMCKGAESNFFNGPTNITSSRFLVFGVKGLLQASASVKNAMLFNVLSFLSDKLLTEGNTVASIDELYLFLSNPTTIEYIRSFMKRVRKKNSAVLLASQNLEDFALPGIAELTKPLFSIPTHQFLFNAGSIDRRFFMDNLQLEDSEYELIRFPQQGVCLYKCGNERYLLEVVAPEYKAALFGTSGGR